MSTAACTSRASHGAMTNGDPPITPYDPYGPGPSVSAYAGDEAIDD
jgi:hypothetical protein